MNFYNEHDPKAAAWLRQLITDGLIPNGVVDERSIADILPRDLDGYTQCHWFAGISGWSLALQLAGWPVDRPVWTGSCPCQPFSTAGKGAGIKDERHLWPEFMRLIKACRPEVVFGEQVASAEVVGTELEAAFVVAVQRGEIAKANKLAKRVIAQSGFTYTPRWVDGIQADLENANYAFWNLVLGAHSVNSPHIRQRLYWLADAKSQRSGECGYMAEKERNGIREVSGQRPGLGISGSDRSDGTVGEPNSPGWQPGESAAPSARHGSSVEPASDGDAMANASSMLGAQHEQEPGEGLWRGAGPHDSAERGGHHEPANPWDDFTVIACLDGKCRRIPRQSEPGVQPLADGFSDDVDAGWRQSDGSIFPLAKGVKDRVPLLKGPGNAIVSQTAAIFVRAYIELNS